MGNENEIRLIGSGDKVSLDSFKKDVKRADLGDSKSVKLFDYYAGSDGVLDETEFGKLFSDIESYSVNTADIIANKDVMMRLYESRDVRNRTFEPDEILRFLKDKGLEKKMSVTDVVEFFNQMTTSYQTEQLHEDISALAMKSQTLGDLKDISPENMTHILSAYKTKYGMSMIQHIAYKDGAWGSTREEHINVIRDKLIEQAELYGVPTDEFKAEFDAEIKNMDLTWFSSGNATKLDEIVNRFVAKLEPKEKLYKENKSGILQMMADPDLCWTGADKNELANSIIKYANKVNFGEMIDNLSRTASNSKIKSAARTLKNSGYADYFPIFMAAIISHETQFREFNDNIFTKNGRGIMQLTPAMMQDMFANQSMFDDEFMSHLNDMDISDAVELEDAVCDRESSDLNMYAGAAGLKYKMSTTLRKIANGSIPNGINMSHPECIMQYMAMEYNGNREADIDNKYPKKNGKTVYSQVRYVYSRDVIQRFKRFTPAGVVVNNYYEYNPITKKFVTH